MKRYLWIAAAFTFLAFPAWTAIIYSTGTGVWTDGSKWSDSNPAAAGNEYVIGSGHRIESPSNLASVTFPGDSLRVESGGALDLYRNIGGATGASLSIAIPNLTIAGGTLRSRIDYATGHVTLTSPIDFDGGGNIEVSTTAGLYSHNFTLQGAITGDGTVNVSRTTQGTGRSIIFDASATGFIGDWVFSGAGSDDRLNVTFNSATSGWGSGNVLINDWVNFNLSASFDSYTSALEINGSNVTFNLNENVLVSAFTINSQSLAEGLYDASDLTALGLGGTYGGTGSIYVVPEAASGILALLGFVFLLKAHRR